MTSFPGSMKKQAEFDPGHRYPQQRPIQFKEDLDHEMSKCGWFHIAFLLYSAQSGFQAMQLDMFSMNCKKRLTLVDALPVTNKCILVTPPKISYAIH